MKDYSVIIPVYNNESIIDDILSRVLRLSIECEDIIIIDDCSSDDTKEIIENFILINDLSSVRLYSNCVNMGPAYSRNVGIRKSRCKYIAFLDSDDDWHPNKIEYQIYLMKKHKADVSGTLHKVVTKNKLPFLYSSILPVDNVIVTNISWPSVLFKSPFSTPSVVMKKELAFYFNEQLRYAEDFNLWIRLSKEFKVIRIEENLTYTFKHDFLSTKGSLSSNIYAMQKGEIYNYINLFHSVAETRKDKVLICIAIFFSYGKFFRRLILKWLSNRK